MWWTSQDGLLAFLQLTNALVPSGNDLTHANFEFDWLTAVMARIEDSAIEEFASVVHLNLGAFGHNFTRPLILWFNLQWLKFDKTFLNEILNLLRVLRHPGEGVHQVAIAH